jgi:SAM-dependent methyltransferase
MSIRFELPPAGRLQANDAKDPLPYYYGRWTGGLYRHRLQMGLRLLPDRPQRLLEVGVGSGILVPTLTAHSDEYVGADLVLAPGLESLVKPPCDARFLAADLLDHDALPENAFDAVLCLSVLEHIRDAAAAATSLARTLAPGGTLVAGYPMVSGFMTRAFRAIGYGSIEEDHVTTPAQIADALRAVLQPRGRAALPPGAPARMALYQCTAWTN